MFSNVDLRTRQVLLILVLTVAAAGAALLAFQRMHKSDSSPTPVSAPKPAPAQHKPAVHHAAPVPHKAAKPKPTAKPADPNRLPAAIREAFAADRVVVVGLYDPKAKIDGSAIAEARAGARLTDSSFVAVNVRTNGVTSLNAKYGVIQDPAVLVLRPSGELVVRIDGFADRDTVAQAAANAAS